MDQTSGASASEIYYFLSLVERVAKDDDSVHRRIEALSPGEKSALAREVLTRAGDIEMDDVGRFLVHRTILDALQEIGK